MAASPQKTENRPKIKSQNAKILRNRNVSKIHVLRRVTTSKVQLLRLWGFWHDGQPRLYFTRELGVESLRQQNGSEEQRIIERALHPQGTKSAEANSLGRLFWRRCSQWATTPPPKILFIFLWWINFSSPPTRGASDVPCLPRLQGRRQFSN